MHTTNFLRSSSWFTSNKMCSAMLCYSACHGLVLKGLDRGTGWLSCELIGEAGWLFVGRFVVCGCVLLFGVHVYSWIRS